MAMTTVGFEAFVNACLHDVELREKFKGHNAAHGNPCKPYNNTTDQHEKDAKARMVGIAKSLGAQDGDQIVTFINDMNLEALVAFAREISDGSGNNSVGT